MLVLLQIVGTSVSLSPMLLFIIKMAGIRCDGRCGRLGFLVHQETESLLNDSFPCRVLVRVMSPRGIFLLVLFAKQSFQTLLYLGNTGRKITRKRPFFSRRGWLVVNVGRNILTEGDYLGTGSQTTLHCQWLMALLCALCVTKSSVNSVSYGHMWRVNIHLNSAELTLHGRSMEAFQEEKLC